MGPDPLAPATGTPGRRYDLDWLRVSVFLLLILYHVGMFFVPWSWHVKNPEPAGQWLQVPMFLVSQWRLPLLFLVSGAAVQFALRRRSRLEFVRERLIRLLVPLVFGMLVVVPPQVYYERLTEGAVYANYLGYLPDAFVGGPYPGGNVSWHHLWFVAYALVYALVAVPLFHALRSARGRSFVRVWASWLGRPGRIYLLALPLVASEVALRPAWPSTHTLIGDWANLVTYFLVFVLGYVLYSDETFGAAIERQRRSALGLAAGAAATLLLIRQTGTAVEPGYTAAYLTWVAWKVVNAWLWIVAIMGYARRYMNRGGGAVRAANEAVYPFYILHQTVTVAIAYHLIDWPAPVPVKFVVIAAGTLAGTAALYLAIRRSPVTRVLFGMKARAAGPHVAAPVAVREIRSWA
jgi:glucans biosynthesis protein C